MIRLPSQPREFIVAAIFPTIMCWGCRCCARIDGMVEASTSILCKPHRSREAFCTEQSPRSLGERRAVFNDDSAPEFAGHYVNDVSLVLTAPRCLPSAGATPAAQSWVDGRISVDAVGCRGAIFECRTISNHACAQVRRSRRWAAEDQRVDTTVAR
jgi:hypothetical protein